MYKQVIIVRNDLKMGKGKIAAQTAHASIEAYKKALKSNPGWVVAWEDEGTQKTVLKVGSEEELLYFFESLKKKFPTVLIHDAGHTQIDAGTATCVGVGPALESELDKVTGKLKLL